MSLADLQANTITAPAPRLNDKVHYPVTIYTDSYLNDPVQYAADDRFIPASVTTVLSVEMNQATRDLASFYQVNVANDAIQNVAVNTYSQTWNRSHYELVINSKFQYFV